MNLYEFEGKKIFSEYGIPIPNGVIFSKTTKMEKIKLDYPVVAKAQTLTGKRGRQGLIIPCRNKEDLQEALKKLFSEKSYKQLIDKILVESYIANKENEYYVGITYDTSTKGPVLLVSKSGGEKVEEYSEKKDSMIKIPFDIRFGLQPHQIRKSLADAGFSGIHFLSLPKIFMAMWKVFENYDARLVEINPLIENENEEFIAADSKIILDEDAFFRKDYEKFPDRGIQGAKTTEREKAAKLIDQNDHRGSSGSTFIDLDGDIAIIAAGGGGSMVNIDALIALGGKPANYTEHSGNPPREKIRKLTQIVLSKKGLKGCWFVGATANFTDIYETLSGFVEGLRTIKPKPGYPIVIRRGGPRYEEAFAMLKEVGKKEGFDFHIFGPETPMTSTAKIIVDLANKFK